MATVAAQCREEGNGFYRAKRYEDAIRSYTRAIQHSSNDATLFTNRALAKLQQGAVDEALDDALRAAEINTNLPKAWYLKGKCLARKANAINASGAYCLATPARAQMLSKASVALKRGFQCSSPGTAIYADIFHGYFVCRRQCYDALRELRLSPLLDSLSAKSCLGESSEVDEVLNAFIGSTGNPLTSSIVAELEECGHGNNSPSKEAAAGGGKHSVANSLKTGRTCDDSIPEAFLCPITFDVMRDPVICVANSSTGTPHFSETTYERSAIEAHYRVSKTLEDPITRQSMGLRPPLLIANTTLRNTIIDYLEQRPWLYDGGSLGTSL